MTDAIPDEILGVKVDKEFFTSIETWEQSCDALRELSRPRHRLDTTDEWLETFYACVEESMRVLEKLGDQSDLRPHPVSFDLVNDAMRAHLGLNTDNTKNED